MSDWSVRARTGVAFAAIVVAVFAFNIEGETFRRLIALAFAGFTVHAILPAQYRLRFFALLSAGSVLVALGPRDGAVTLLIGTMLLGICHLPLPFRYRVVLLVASASGLAVMRAGIGPAIVPTAVWPMAASMLMLRLVLYLLSLRRQDAPFDVARGVAYVFMIPNAALPFFPLVDYRTFANSAESAPDAESDTIGLRWMWRGLLHLVAYRFIFAEVAPRELFIYSLGDLVRHLLAVVLLYLKVSGLFHFVVGLLHIFGFRLPETHRAWLLATSLPDYWRRINIYWRDFMAKVVYYPVIASMRGRAPTTRLVVATLAVFALSWALHAYQRFWITGSPALSWHDAVFWAVLALLMVSSLLRGSDRRSFDDGRRWNGERARRTLVTFATLVILWSFWSMESFTSWLHMWTEALNVSASDVMLLVSVTGAIWLVAGFDWDRERSLWLNRPLGRRWEMYGRTSVLLIASVVVHPALGDLVPVNMRQRLSYLAGRSGALDDVELWQIPAYYEVLTNAVPARPAAQPLEPPDTLFIPRNDFLLTALRPGLRLTVLGQPLSTNTHGLRDREYEVPKPAGTFRVVLLGGSDVMGAGVSDTETMDALAEASLDSMRWLPGRKVEVLNLGFYGRSLAQRAWAVRAQAGVFDPDLIVLTVYPVESSLDYFAFAQATERAVPIPDSLIATLVASTGLNPADGDRFGIARLRPIEMPVMRRSIQWAAEEANTLGAPLVILALPILTVAPANRQGRLPLIRSVAKDLSVPVLDCTQPYRGHDVRSLALSDADPHPNAAGHRLLAACLVDRLTRLPMPE